MNSEVELIAGVIRGNFPPEDLPAPRLIKIFLSCEFNEFQSERKELLENVGPELQSIYADMGIEVLLIDVHYGMASNPYEDSNMSESFLKEISAAKRHSRGCFMIAFAGSGESTEENSIVEKQLEYALSLDPNGSQILILKPEDFKVLPNSCVARVDESNILLIDENWREAVLERIQTLVNSDVEAKPELKSRKRLVQEVYAESLCHLGMLRGVSEIEEEDSRFGDVLEKVKKSMEFGKTHPHPPILLYGQTGSLKSNLLSTIYLNASKYLSKSTLRIVRLCNKTARSAYSLELLRSLSQHLGFLIGYFDGNLPKEASFEPLYLNNWWTQILRSMEKNNFDEEIVILIDDIDRLRRLEGDIVAALVWLPVCLPPGVHVIITTTTHPNNLRLTPAQKSRLENEDILMRLPEAQFKNPLPDVSELTDLIGEKAAHKMSSILLATEFGLSETEILELLMPTNGEGPLELDQGEFSFATWCMVKWKFSEYFEIRVMSGRLLFSFSSTLKTIFKSKIKNLSKIHLEISSIFFSESSENLSEVSSPRDSLRDLKETPFNTNSKSKIHRDVTYSLRHIDEAWYHLLKSEDTEKLKENVVCAFDFLLAAVQMISVSYLRCVLEHVRRYFLDRDVELVYYAVRKSSDVLTRDPMQLGAQLISWLRSVADDCGDLVSKMITSAMAWCDGYTAPLLVPLNSWLQQPLPLQVRSLTIPQGVKLISGSPLKQFLIVVPPQGEPQLRHVISGQLLNTFKGHSAPVTCVATSSDPDLVFTASEDTTVIVWDLKSLRVLHKIQEHTASVLCLAYSKKNQLIMSGGEDSKIITYDLSTGRCHTLSHHKTAVTSLSTDSSSEILISGSKDCRVCLFCLDTFTLLNTIPLPSPVTTISVSWNSVFLLVACEDKKLYLRSLATGTDIHQLRGHNGPITALGIARDCHRAVAGGADGRISVFDMHSGRLLRSLLVPSAGSVTALYCTEKDDFLVSGGGNRITFWSFRSEESHQKERKGSKSTVINEHTAAINCLSISRDGTMVATGGVDSMVNLWQLNSCELVSSFEGHIASVTCVDFSASGLFIASGSEDKTVRVWGLTLGLVVATFQHQSSVTSVKTLMDGRRIISSDRSGFIRVWAADTGVLIQSVSGPGSCLAVSNDMRYAVCGTGDNILRIVSLFSTSEDESIVSHSQEITCLTLSPDSQSLITGSRDMSLKVWQLCGGKLSQILVGHSDHVTCVAVSLCDKSIVVSGSRDANLIVWDINTGSDLHTLQGHLGFVTCVRISDDGSVCASGSEDKSLILWDTKKGTCLSSISLHVPVLGVEMTSDCSRLALFLLEHRCMPILCLHNTPAQYVKVPNYSAKEVMVQGPKEMRVQGTKRPVRRLLKKEVSLDTYTWQRKYGHLTAGLPISEERLKRRFSVSASMEEISKTGLNNNEPKQAGLEQSKHFDQLEAIWNKQTPSRRILGKQGSLRECKIEDSEEEELPD